VAVTPACGPVPLNRHGIRRLQLIVEAYTDANAKRALELLGGGGGGAGTVGALECYKKGEAKGTGRFTVP